MSTMSIWPAMPLARRGMKALSRPVKTQAVALGLL